MTETMSIAEWKKQLHTPVRKYKNVKCEVDGRKFDSRLEARRYEELKNLAKLGQVKWFTRQVPFQLPGNITYRADFVVVWRIAAWDAQVTVEDCKGFMTRVSQNKIKQVEALYGIKIELITKERYRK